MSLAIQRSADFRRDFDLQVEWYLDHAPEEVSWKFADAVQRTLTLLTVRPDAGRLRHFKHPRLDGLRSCQVLAPFSTILIFYRHTTDGLFAERLMHGARDLPRRLTEPPVSSTA